MTGTVHDRAALGGLVTKLAPGGRLLLTVPAMPSLWSGHDVAHHHQRRYTARTLEAVVHEAGFRTIHRGAFNSLLLPAVVAVRTLNKLLRRQGSDDDALPPAPINRLLAALFGGERYFAARGLLPFGISLALVAQPAGVAGSPGRGGTTR